MADPKEPGGEELPETWEQAQERYLNPKNEADRKAVEMAMAAQRRKYAKQFED